MSRRVKLPTPSKKDCKPQPMECFGPAPSQAQLKMISQKSGIPFYKLQELVREINSQYKSLGKGTKKTKQHKKRKTRNNTGGITDRNKDRIVTSLMVIMAGGASFYGIPMLGNWFVSVGVLPRLCAQNMLQHVFVETFREITQLPMQTCHDISQDYQARVTGMIGTLLGTGLINYRNIKDFYNLTHAFIKAKIFGTAEEADAAQAALIAAGAERATAAQTALAQREQQTQARRREEEAALTSEKKAEQKAERETIEANQKLGFFGRPTEASTKFFSEQGKKKPALKRSASDVGQLGGPPRAESKGKPFAPGRTASPLAASIPLPPQSFKSPTGAPKAATLPVAAPKKSSRKAASKKPPSDNKASKGGSRRSTHRRHSRRSRRRRGGGYGKTGLQTGEKLLL